MVVQPLWNTVWTFLKKVKIEIPLQKGFIDGDCCCKVRATALVQQTWVKSAEAFWRLIKKPCAIYFKDARKTFSVWSSPVPSSGYLDHAPQEGTAVFVKALLDPVPTEGRRDTISPCSRQLRGHSASWPCFTRTTSPFVPEKSLHTPETLALCRSMWAGGHVSAVKRGRDGEATGPSGSFSLLSSVHF